MYSKAKAALLTSSTALIVLSTAAAAQDEWTLSGYAKTYAVIQTEPDIAGLEPFLADETAQFQNALRLMLAGDLSDIASFELHYEFKPVFSSTAVSGDLTGLGSTTSSSSTSWRWRDINNEMPSDDGERVLRQNLDRFNIRFALENADLTIGRQALTVGSGRFVRPTDIFEPFGVATLDTEYRVGVDAIRWQGPLGDFSEYDIGYVIGKDGKWENSALYGRVKQGGVDADFEGILILRDSMTLIGGGMESAIGDMGFWAEGAYTFSSDDDNYARLSLGLDRALTENTIVMVEYHYSGAGASDAEDYIETLDTAAFSDGGVYLLGQHYLIGSLSWTATPLLGIAASTFINASDGSVFLSASAQYSLTENLYTDLGFQYGLGDGGTASLAPPSLALGSEFGVMAPTVFASLRYYF